MEPETSAPAHVSRVDGAATLEREGRAESSPLNMPLLSGDRLKTADGRVEVQFADGSTLHLDSGSTIDVQSDELLRLTEGRLRLNILGPLDGARGGPAGAVAYRIDSPAGSARITQPGEYRIALLKSTEDTQLELAVLRGAADVFTDLGSTPVRAGERAYASAGLAPSYAYSYNSANWDAFDRWSEERRNVRLGASSQYLPADMQSYAPLLDESGDWRQTASYGYAWYPRVSSDWRPYYNGRWDSYPRYGWTWIGADRFAWPTHHYGRWGFSAGVWFWIPSSRWAPAYVSWAYAPGYVSWCPLGFDNRPIIAVDLYRVGPSYYSPWRAWTAVSYSHFGGRGSYVNQRAVNWDHLSGQRPHFETRPSAPAVSRDVAVPRNSTPVRWAGSRSLPPEGGSHESGSGDLRRPASVDRNAAATTRDAASSTRGSWLPPSGGSNAAVARGTATPRTGAAPRYINRGDEIVRSATERPTPRAASPATAPRDSVTFDRRPAAATPESATRSTYAAPRTGETRTIPDGRARPAPPALLGAPDTTRAMPRGDSYPQTATTGVETRRAYQPVDRGAPRSNEGTPRPAAPRAQPATIAPQGWPSSPARQSGPMSFERPRTAIDAPQRDPSTERAAPGPDPSTERAARVPDPSTERAAPGRPTERSPSRSEPRQAPAPERAAPAERQPPSAPRAGSAERPAPAAGMAVPRRGGRGGV